MINIVYSKTKTYNGIRAYSENLFSDMSKVKTTKFIPLPKIEISLFNKKIGGWTTQQLLSWQVNAFGIVHSTSHWDLVRNTNIVTIHDLYPIIYPEIYKITNRIEKFYKKTLMKVQNRAKAIIVQSPHIKDQVDKFIKDIPVYSIPTKIFTEDTNFNPYPNDGKLHLITMGEIHGDLANRKRIFELYDWVANNPEVDLYHIGRITDPKYFNYASNIHRVGSVTQEQKFGYLKYADKFVFKTLGEGQGLPTMEAMKLGTQVVVNDLPEHRFFLGDKPYYYETKDEFLEAIYKPKKQGLSEQIGQYDNWIEKYFKVYEEVIK